MYVGLVMSKSTFSHLPMLATIVDRVQETPDIFTIKLKLNDGVKYAFSPGQFNMLYLYGVGEIPISIVSDPVDNHVIGHTIRVVGRVTQGMSKLNVGDQLGLRGPFGRGWPVTDKYTGQSKKDVVIVTGGLGCAPVVSVIHYILRRRDEFGRLIIFQGVKHTADLIWKKQYDQWASLPNVEVRVAASQSVANPHNKTWPWYSGHVTNMIKDFSYDEKNTIAMMCGPEPMMLAAVDALKKENLADESIWLSMERNMQCAIGHCGHCQLGSRFICKQGPVFPYSDIKELLGKRGL